MKPNRTTAIAFLLLLLAPGASLPATARGWPPVARISGIVRDVRVAPPRRRGVVPARIGMGLSPGTRLRPRARSGAIIRFADRSTLRVDQSSEVVVGAARHPVRVLRGRVVARYARPGTVRGGRATAAVRG
jgi:hypothetical protein